MKTSLITLIIASLALAVAGPGLAGRAFALTPHEEAINTAIEDGLAWLRANQNADGSWDAYGDYWVGGAGMATLAFLEQGYDESDSAVADGIAYILSMQQPNGSICTSQWDDNYETSCAIWALAATGGYHDEIAEAVDWLVKNQWDEAFPSQCPESDEKQWGGFGYGWDDRPDLSNSQFSLIALRAAELDPASPTWSKAITFTQRCRGTENGFIYLPGESLAGGTTSYGSMTAAGVWALRLCGRPTEDEYVQGGLNWLKDNYAYDTNPVLSWMHYYYIWSAAKAFLICDIKGEIGGLIPVETEDEPAFDPGWYYDFSKYLVSVQNTDGSWFREDTYTDTFWALLTLQKAVAIPYAVQVSISPDVVEVEPGETAPFIVTVDNIGTAEDDYDMDVEDLPVELAWEFSEDPVENLPGGEFRKVDLSITPAYDLAIWDDTPFDFHARATSATDPSISDATTATVIVKVVATPPSKVRYVDELLDELIAYVEDAEIQKGVKNSLLSKLENAERKKEQGLAFIDAESNQLGANMLGAAINILEAFLYDVVAQTDKNIDEADAYALIPATDEIIARLHIIIDLL